MLAIALNTAVVKRFVILGEAKDLCTRYSALGTRYSVLGTRYSVLGAQLHRPSL